MGNDLKLALIGRPNVGKSALFNRICKKKIAIVDEAEGITRDRLYAEAEFFGQPFQIIDTGGIDLQSQLPFQEEVRRQTEIAIVEADTLVMVVDARIGITALDEQVAKMLLRVKKPVCVAVNKVDDFDQQDLLHQFYALGIHRMVAVSAAQGFQIAELLETAFEGLAFPSEQEEKESSIKVAIVGRPNVGKSTLVNHLMQEERCVVSPIAGTTRDSIDVQFEAEGTVYTLIDTAGIRRKHSEHEVVDKFAAIRTERAIDRCDICVLMVEAQSGLTAQEKGIARHIEDSGKGCLLLFNKWDLIKGFRMEHCLKTIREQVPFLSHCPALFVSAKTGRNLKDLFSLLKEVHTQQTRRVTTGQLNKFIERTLQKYHPPMLQGKRLRIYYMAQVDVHPPKFVLFVNNPELMSETYKKYIINQFREEYGFTGVPLLFVLKGRQIKETSAEKTTAHYEEAEDCEEEIEDILIE
jgi:GTPase